MNLEESNEYFQFQESKSKKKKIILFFIILLILAVVALVISIVVLKKKDSNTSKLFINGNKANWSSTLFLSKDDNTYVSCKDMADIIGGEYLKGEYKAFTQDKDKGYIQTKYEVITFSSGSKYVKKYLQNELDLEDVSDINEINTEESAYIVNSKNDTMELYELSSEIIFENDLIYIPIEDMEKVFNVDFSNNGNSIYIYTLDYLYQYAINFVSARGITNISNTYENVRALVEDMVIVANDNEKYGVISLKTGEQVLSYQYSKIIYIQNASEFFVYTKNSVGLLDNNGDTIISPTKYDELTVFDEINKLYLAKKNSSYGLLNVDGDIVIPVSFKSIGVKSLSDYEEFEIPDSETPNLLASKFIVVADDKSYGLYNLKGEKLLRTNYSFFGYLATSQDKDFDIQSTLLIPKKIGINGLIIKQNKLYGIYDLDSKEIVIPCSLNKIYCRTESGESDYYMLLGEEEISIKEYFIENLIEPYEENDEDIDEEFDEEDKIMDGEISDDTKESENIEDEELDDVDNTDDSEEFEESNQNDESDEDYLNEEDEDFDMEDDIEE